MCVCAGVCVSSTFQNYIFKKSLNFIVDAEYELTIRTSVSIVWEIFVVFVSTSLFFVVVFPFVFLPESATICCHTIATNLFQFALKRDITMNVDFDVDQTVNEPNGRHRARTTTR